MQNRSLLQYFMLAICSQASAFCFFSFVFNTQFIRPPVSVAFSRMCLYEFVLALLQLKWYFKSTSSFNIIILINNNYSETHTSIIRFFFFNYILFDYLLYWLREKGCGLFLLFFFFCLFLPFFLSTLACCIRPRKATI